MGKTFKDNVLAGIVLLLLGAILTYGVSIESRVKSIEQDVAVIKDRLSLERKVTVGLQ